MASTKENDGHSMSPANPFDDVFSTKGHVQVRYQIHSGWLPFDGMTVVEARGYVQRLFDIAPDAVPFVDSTEVDENTVLCEGQTLVFIRPFANRC